MAFQSTILRGSGPNGRLEAVATGAASIKQFNNPVDDPEAVRRIQRGLVKLGAVMPISFKGGDADGKFGGETTSAVTAFQKKAFPNDKKEWDGRVGKKTLEKLDEALPKAGNQPRPPAPPVVGTAGLLVGPLGTQASLIKDYYNFCGLETIGPGQLNVGAPTDVRSFEDLLDKLATQRQGHQVIVNHGDSADGLLMPLTRDTGFKKTGQVIGDLAALADRFQQGDTNPNSSINKVMIDGVAQDANITKAAVQRLVNKLLLVRQNPQALHFRACNLSDSDLVLKYKRAFGARIITFHGCRLLFVRIDPQQFKAGHGIAELKGKPSTAKTRLRFFEDPFGEFSSMFIAIDDLDGHTRVQNFALIERKTPADVLGWARVILRRWTNAANFVMPVMWDNTELTYHLPLETGWRMKLKFV